MTPSYPKGPTRTPRDRAAVVTPACDPGAEGPCNPAASRQRPLPTDGIRPPRTVAIRLDDRRWFPFMAGIVLAVPGLIVEDEGSGTRVRVLPDGSLEEILPGGHPRPGCAHATARTT